VLGATLAGTAAYAQPVNENPPTWTIMCLDVSGRALPSVCRVPGSRLDPREDICVCPQGQRVEVSICPTGVDAPAESLALMKARRAQLHRGSLVGASYQGRPMCVEPRLNR
jgi:hypothetical protein